MSLNTTKAPTRLQPLMYTETGTAVTMTSNQSRIIDSKIDIIKYFSKVYKKKEYCKELVKS